MNYYLLIQDAHVKSFEASRLINTEPIWLIWEEYVKEPKTYYVSQWLFWRWALLMKKKNRKFAEAMIKFCEDIKSYCSYSDYHKAYYIWLCKSREYERMCEYFKVFCNILRDNWIDTIDYTIDYD